MATNPLKLRGCTPEPLGNYLKALGVFRLVAEQADPNARAWWQDGILHIYTGKNELCSIYALQDWLRQECQFSPMIAPWQKGAGFLPVGKRDQGAAALATLLENDLPGVRLLRDSLTAYRRTLGVTATDIEKQTIAVAEMVATKDHPLAKLCKDLDLITRKSAAQNEILNHLRNELSDGPVLDWIDAVGRAVTNRTGDATVRWFPLLGDSGGGEASGKYIVNLMQRLAEELAGDGASARRRLLAALDGVNAIGATEADAMAAMYFPAMVEAPNIGQQFVSKPKRRVNPWDFILLLEGTLLWSAAVSRRHDARRSLASFPFYCKSSLGSADVLGPKEIAGAENSIASGEIWCPLWSQPVTLAELRRCFGEGRFQLHDRVCQRSWEFAQAVSNFGTDRGISAFARFALLGRSGSGNNTTLLAVSLGRRAARRVQRTNWLSQLDSFLTEVSDYILPNSQLPRRLFLAREDLERSLFRACDAVVDRQDSHTHRVAAEQNVLLSAGGLVSQLALTRGIVKFKIGEQTRQRTISPVDAIRIDVIPTTHRDEDTLAIAVASLTAPCDETPRTSSRIGPVVTNVVPVVAFGNVREWYDPKKHRDARDSAVWSSTAPLADNFARVLRRRLIDSHSTTADGLPLWSPRGASFSSLLAFWQGNLDERRVADLIHAYALVDWGMWTDERIDTWQASNDPTPDLDTSHVWFDADDEAHLRMKPLEWHGRTILTEYELRCAFELPRVYCLLKLCFVGGRLPARAVPGRHVKRTGTEKLPAGGLDILNLLQSNRLADALGIAMRRLRAKGLPPILEDTASIESELVMSSAELRRLAGMLLIPVPNPGILAALATKPATTFD